MLGPVVHFDAYPHAVFGPGPSKGYSLFEVVIPGAEVRGWTNRWTRWRELPANWLPTIQGWRVTVSLHSAWLVEHELREAGVHVHRVERSWDCAQVELGLYPDVHREALEDYGRTLLEAAWRRGELTDRLLDEAKPYQVAAPAWTSTRPWSALFWRPGAGKTPGAVAAIAASPARRVLVICPAAARKEWRADADRVKRRPTSIEKYSTYQVFRLMPPSEQRTTDETWEAYDARMEQEGKRRIAVVGLESMDLFSSFIGQFQPEMLVYDEIHKFGNPKRWEATADEYGGSTLKRATTDGGRARRSVSAMDLSRIRSVRERVALTGTPLDDGRPRRLWAPGDLLAPGTFGPYSSAFAHRYCGWKKNDAGYPDDSGATHIEELRQRWAAMAFDVPYAESHAAMKGKMRLEVDYFKRADLCKADAMKLEIRKLAREAQRSTHPGAHQRVREALLAEAASMKRTLVRTRAADFLADGQKVMVYLSRKALCDRWAEDFEKLAPGWVAHGDMGPRRCDDAVEAYAAQEGAAWLIGTWDAIGESKNGMQCTNLGVIAQFPLKPAQWIQGVGRWDRIDGVGTIVWVPIADGTQDVKEVLRLTRRFGPIEKFLNAPELRELGDALEGTWDDALEDELIAKIVGGGALEDSDFDE